VEVESWKLLVERANERTKLQVVVNY